MAITGSSWEDLRQNIRQMLDKSIPEAGLSSDDKQFKVITGMDTPSLKKAWAGGSLLTSCNAFLGWAANQIGVQRGSVLRGALDISKAEKEVPGCWLEANTGEAIDYDLHPKSGDFYSSPHHFKATAKAKAWTQKWGHVGLVYDYDEYSGMWTLVQGGQGGPNAGRDFIKWSTTKFDRTKINGWVDIACYMMPDGPDGSDRESSIYSY